jgi:cell division protein FtsW
MKKDENKNVERKWFLAIVVFLIIVGFLNLATVSAPISLSNFGVTDHYLIHALIYGLCPGVMLGVLFFLLPLKKIKKYTPILFLSNLIVASLVFIPSLGVKLQGARRWLSIGPITFQPSEFLKVSFILYMAYLLSVFSKKKEVRKSTIVFLIISAMIVALLVAQSDISTLVIILSTGVGMYFMSGISWRTFVMVLLAGSILLGGVVLCAPYRVQRLTTFFFPGEADSLNEKYQAQQLILAVGSGGVVGKGVGLSTQKFGFLPYSMSDSIFAIISEEVGLLGASILILALIAFAVLGLKIAIHSSDLFYNLIGMGVIFWIMTQSAIHIAANLGAIPLTGVPLPFFSYGGSALVVELIGISLILNVSKK